MIETKGERIIGRNWWRTGNPVETVHRGLLPRDSGEDFPLFWWSWPHCASDGTPDPAPFHKCRETFKLFFSLIISDFQINFWEKERNAAVLRRHWDMWFPRRTRLELGTVISSLVTTQLQIFCGMKNGRIAVYDQNLWPAAVLGGCILELETKVIRRYAKISQSRRRPLLWPSPGWKGLLALSHFRHY